MSNYLTYDERMALAAYEGCACCRDYDAIDAHWRDDCPTVIELDEPIILHSHEGGCVQNLAELVERIIAAKVAGETP